MDAAIKINSNFNLIWFITKITWLTISRLTTVDHGVITVDRVVENGLNLIKDSYLIN